MSFLLHLVRSLDADLFGGAMLLAELVLFGSFAVRRTQPHQVALACERVGEGNAAAEGDGL